MHDTVINSMDSATKSGTAQDILTTVVQAKQLR